MAPAAGNRVVLTGGACQLPGVREMAARMLVARCARASGDDAWFAGTCLRPRLFHRRRSVVLGSRRWKAFQDINLDGESPSDCSAALSIF